MTAPASRAGRGRPFVAAVVCGALLGACGGPPVGVKRMNPSAVQRSLTRSVLTSDDVSTTTRNALFQYDLVERFRRQPEDALRVLHERVASGHYRDNDMFALAELSFFYAEHSGKQSYHLAAAVYAWAFLFPTDPVRRQQPLDPRIRIAADLYNRAIARGFARGKKREVVPQAGSYPLPFGTLDVEFDPAELRWGTRRLVAFMPVAELEVLGLATRYRWPGVGAPLAASTEPADPTLGYDDFVEPWIKVPVTALLRLDDVEAELATGRVPARLTLERAVQNETVQVNGERVQLESETTASLAYTLAESPVWQREIGGFLQRLGAVDKGTQLAALSPYRPGRVPVVLVHGTASSPGRWAQMINDLGNDRRIGPKVHFWLFMYDTGNPIAYSAMLLRQSLQDAVARLDPEGTDAALRDMVIIGHSQGGLLTKMTAIDSGTRFWDEVSNRPFADVQFDPDDRSFIERMVFFTPLPMVKRVIFLATPQRGSYIAGNWLAHQVARLVVLPANLTKLGTKLVTGDREWMRARFTGLGTSVIGMTPGSPFITALSSIPLAPGVTAHSIIPVEGDGPLEDGSDGVVRYESAHIDGVESELVVKSSHSCQDNPHTIREVRRILLEHLAAAPS